MWTNPLGRECTGGCGKDLIVEVREPFNSSRQTTRQGQHVQQGVVSSSIAHSRL
jgi:hypothetical protein